MEVSLKWLVKNAPLGNMPLRCLHLKELRKRKLMKRPTYHISADYNFLTCEENADISTRYITFSLIGNKLKA